LLRRVVWYKFTDVSEVLAVSIIRAIATTQKTVIFKNTQAQAGATILIRKSVGNKTKFMPIGHYVLE
jgi:hypothetical protein